MTEPTSTFSLKKFQTSAPGTERPWIGIPQVPFRVRSGRDRVSPEVWLTLLDDGWYLVDSETANTVRLPNLWRGKLHEGMLENGEPCLIVHTRATNPKYQSWEESMRDVLKLARQAWVKHTSNKTAMEHFATPVMPPNPDPAWSDEDFDVLVERSFRDRIIDQNHPLASNRLMQSVSQADLEDDF